jgi:PAS domain-containing protein
MSVPSVPSELDRELSITKAALRLSEARYRIILDSSTDYAIICADLSGFITEWNTGAELIFGWLAADVMGKYLALIFTPADRDSHVPEREIGTALKVAGRRRALAYAPRRNTLLGARLDGAPERRR